MDQPLDPKERVKAELKRRRQSVRGFCLEQGWSPNLLNNWFRNPHRKTVDPATAITMARAFGWNEAQWLADLGLGPQPYEPDPLRQAVRAVRATNIPRDVKEAIVTLLQARYA